MSSTQSRFLILAIVLLLPLTFWWGRSSGPAGSSDDRESSATETATPSVWTCSMHPQIQLPEFGPCPLCGMDLIPQEEPSGSEAAPRSLSLSPAAVALASVETTEASRVPIEPEIRLSGTVQLDEARVEEITAWFPGRIEKLHVDFTGAEVDRGAPLFEIYSPDLYSAQQELLQAKARATSAANADDRLVEAARKKLALLGLSDAQIRSLERRDSPRETLTVRAPLTGTVLRKDAVRGAFVRTGDPLYEIADLSELWLELDAFEGDLAFLRVDQSVSFTVKSWPGRTFEGRVSFVDPVMSLHSRTASVRVVVPNPDGDLRPGMFASATVETRIDSALEEVPVSIPKTAPLRTGNRAVVYVAKSGAPGEFEGRTVTLGRAGRTRVEVLEGLREGEYVVSNGAFKLDSALQIVAKPSMMNPGEDDSSASEQEDAEAPAEDVVPIADLPHAFRQSVDTVLAAYYEIGTALSLDDDGTARTAAGGFRAALQAIDASSLAGDARSDWESLRPELETAERALADGADLESTRDAFYGLSDRVTWMARRFPPSGAVPVLVYHCPMAAGGAGGDWLQGREGTENPYYGSQMYRCGYEKQDLLAEVTSSLAGEPHEH